MHGMRLAVELQSYGGKNLEGYRRAVDLPLGMRCENMDNEFCLFVYFVLLLVYIHFILNFGFFFLSIEKVNTLLMHAFSIV
jgi:hypothetical protein